MTRMTTQVLKATAQEYIRTSHHHVSMYLDPPLAKVDKTYNNIEVRHELSGVLCGGLCIIIVHLQLNIATNEAEFAKC